MRVARARGPWHARAWCGAHAQLTDAGALRAQGQCEKCLKFAPMYHPYSSLERSLGPHLYDDTNLLSPDHKLYICLINYFGDNARNARMVCLYTVPFDFVGRIDSELVP